MHFYVMVRLSDGHMYHDVKSADGPYAALQMGLSDPELIGRIGAPLRVTSALVIDTESGERTQVPFPLGGADLEQTNDLLVRCVGSDIESLKAETRSLDRWVDGVAGRVKEQEERTAELQRAVIRALAGAPKFLTFHRHGAPGGLLRVAPDSIAAYCPHTSGGCWVTLKYGVPEEQDNRVAESFEEVQAIIAGTAAADDETAEAAECQQPAPILVEAIDRARAELLGAKFDLLAQILPGKLSVLIHNGEGGVCNLARITALDLTEGPDHVFNIINTAFHAYTEATKVSGAGDAHL